MDSGYNSLSYLNGEESGSDSSLELEIIEAESASISTVTEMGDHGGFFEMT